MAKQKFVLGDPEKKRPAFELGDDPNAGPRVANPGSTAFTGGLAERLLDNALALPELALAGSGIPAMLKPQGGNILPVPTGREVLSGAQGLLPGNTAESAMAEREQLRVDEPMKSTLGEFGGDVMTLLGGRLPKTGSGGLLDDAMGKGIEALTRKFGTAERGMKAVGRDLVTSPTFGRMIRGFERAGETGIEGAALAILQGGDPVETAAYAAGGQLASSGALSLAQGGFEWPLRFAQNPSMGRFTKAMFGVAANAVVASTFLNLLQNAVPGGDDSPLLAEESAFEKLLAGLAIGLVVGIPGKRPKPGGRLDRFPSLADAILTVPRTVILRMAQSMAEDPAVEKAVLVMGSSPDSFTDKQLKQFNKAAEEGTLSETLKEMRLDDKFRALVDVPLPDLIGVPVKEPEIEGPIFGGRVRPRRR